MDSSRPSRSAWASAGDLAIAVPDVIITFLKLLQITDNAVILKLAHKHPECLAPALCGLDMPGLRLPSIDGKAPCCGPSGCC